MDEKLYTLKDLCRYLSIGRNTALSLLHKKKIKAFKAGKHWLIPPNEIEVYIQNEIHQQK